MSTQLHLIGGRAYECIAAADLDTAAEAIAEGYSLMEIAPRTGQYLLAARDNKGVSLSNLPRHLRQQLLAS